MDGKALAAPLRILGYVVIAAMAAALIYTLWISLTHWPSITV